MELQCIVTGSVIMENMTPEESCPTLQMTTCSSKSHLLVNVGYSCVFFSQVFSRHIQERVCEVWIRAGPQDHGHRLYAAAQQAGRDTPEHDGDSGQ